MQKFVCLSIVAVLAVPNLGVVQQAQGRWKSKYANAPYSEWFAQQRDRNGQSCCNYADAHEIHNAYIKDGKWYVPVDGTVYEIQPEQLLDGPNPTGHAVIWYFDDEISSLKKDMVLFAGTIVLNETKCARCASCA